MCKSSPLKPWNNHTHTHTHISEMKMKNEMKLNNRVREGTRSRIATWNWINKDTLSRAFWCQKARISPNLQLAILYATVTRGMSKHKSYVTCINKSLGEYNVTD